MADTESQVGSNETSSAKAWTALAKPAIWVGAGLFLVILVVWLTTWGVLSVIVGDQPSTLERVLGSYLAAFIGVIGLVAVSMIFMVVKQRVIYGDAALAVPLLRARQTSTAPAATKWTFTWAALVLLVTLIAVPAAMVFAVESLGKNDFDPVVLLPIALIVGLVGLITALSALVAVFVRAGVTNKDAALGFPRGSVRALIALLLILMFAILAVFLYSSVREGETLESVTRVDYQRLLAEDRVVSSRIVFDNAEDDLLDKFNVTISSDPQSTDIAKQLLTTLSTLVVALAAFYFGNRAVETARDAVPDSGPAFALSPDPGEGPVRGSVGGPIPITAEPGDGVTAKVTDARDPSAVGTGTLTEEGEGRFVYVPERPGRFVIALSRRGTTRRLTAAVGVDVLTPTSPARVGVDQPLKIEADPVVGLACSQPTDPDGQAAEAATITAAGPGQFVFTSSAPGTFLVSLTAPSATDAAVEIEVAGPTVELQGVQGDAAQTSEEALAVPLNENSVVAVSPVPDLAVAVTNAAGAESEAVSVMDLPGEPGSFTILPKEPGKFRLVFSAPGSPDAVLRLEVSPKPAGFEGSYIVRAGDSLSKIAAKYETTVDLLLENNPGIANRDRIDVGQKLDVPLVGTAESIQPLVDVDVAELGGKPLWMAFAEREEETGIRDIRGPKSNPRVLEYHATTTGRFTQDDIPWCSSFVNWCIEQAGIKGTGSAAARSWLSWNGGERLSEPVPGCITVFARPPNPSHGHVAFFVEKPGSESVTVLGGNQGDEVNRRTRKAAGNTGVLAYIWPKHEPIAEIAEVAEISPGEDWAEVSLEERSRLAMELLTKTHNYSVAAGAGIVGNLVKESGVMPNRLETSNSSTPMRARGFTGDKTRIWSPEEIRDRDESAKRGPARPGVGLAQWTSAGRRKRLFESELGVDILYSMEGQVAYLVHELGQPQYSELEKVLRRAKVTYEQASDEFLYRFEKPASVLTPDKSDFLPRTAPSAKKALEERRKFAETAHDEYVDSERVD
ncbi:MAG: TIGR02594 family protein [bacterium]|nr:TIGR02594 family protein [bacterium]